jgi:hypothetical protein
VAAMPSFGLKQQLGVAVLTAAIFALSAGAASANEAWVWACHGPSGTSIATPMVTGVKADGTAGYNCAGDDNSGATLRLVGANPAAGSSATLQIALPPGAPVSRLAIVHAVHGSAAGARYTVKLGGDTILSQPLDDPVATLPADFTRSGSETLSFSLTCDAAAPCGGPVSVDIVKAAALIDDTKAPYGNVNRNSPTNDFTEMIASAIEEGVGLGHADVLIATAPRDDAVVTTKSVPFSNDAGTCDDLSPNAATIDLPLDPTRCITGSGDAKFLTGRDKDGKRIIGTSVDTSGLPEGIYYRRMIAYDAAGNGNDLFHIGGSVWEAFEVWHPVLGSPSQTLSIGSSSNPIAEPQPNTKPNQNGTVGNQSASCRSPRLSVSLSQKPLRVSKSVAVLQYGKRYRFEGRLTCVVNGRRISAPKRTKIELLNKVGKKTVTKTGPKIADKGRFKVSLKYPVGSRTLIFRFRNANGQRSQVSIKIKTEKKKKSKR